jgi:hypothetical protein
VAVLLVTSSTSMQARSAAGAADGRAGRPDRQRRLARGADAVAARVAGRMERETLIRLLGLVEAHDPDTDEAADEDPSLVRWLKSSTGDISLTTMDNEIDKLLMIRSFNLPGHLLVDVVPKVVAE